MAGMLVEDLFKSDRRRVVNAGIQHGREIQIADMRSLAEIEANNSVTVVATRGERLVLTRVYSSNSDLRHGEFGVEMLAIVEIAADQWIAAFITFDSDDIDAAFEELDARYLAGEGAPYSRTWTAMTQVQTAYNRHELIPTPEDWVNVDHRHGRAFASGDVIPFISGTWKLVPNIKGHIEAVHRLSNFGTVITEVMTGTSEEGFDAEWREIGLFAFDGDLVCRFEIFDEEDLDAALARFDELNGQVPPLEDTVTQT